MASTTLVRLSPHFTLDEMTFSETAIRLGLDNTPNDQVLSNLHRLADAMERVRTLLGDLPIIVTSGYRSYEVNSAISPIKISDHCLGLACDFKCPGFGSPYDVALKLAESEETLNKIPVGQLLYENVGQAHWVHLSIRPQEKPVNRVLTYDAQGYRPGILPARDA